LDTGNISGVLKIAQNTKQVAKITLMWIKKLVFAVGFIVPAAAPLFAALGGIEEE